jgi:transposase
MRIAPAITLSSEQRATLERRARSRSLPARVVERARIVLLAAEGQQDIHIAARMKITPKKVSRWRKRFLTLGMAGLEREAPRPGRTPTITGSVVRRVVNLTTRQKPPNATHWSTRTMAAAAGISEASVRRIWHRHGLKPHRVDSFKISNDPEFAEIGDYSLFIVASEERDTRVFQELRRPTFSGTCLRLNEVIRFLGYGKVREIDIAARDSRDFGMNIVVTAGESVPQA